MRKEKFKVEKEVVVYTQTGCADCRSEKKFLSERGVEFTEKNIQEDQQAFVELVELGYQTTPVTTVDGEIVVGFDPRDLREKLSL